MLAGRPGCRKQGGLGNGVIVLEHVLGAGLAVFETYLCTGLLLDNRNIENMKPPAQPGCISSHTVHQPRSTQRSRSSLVRQTRL